jgi:hypothetical protein
MIMSFAMKLIIAGWISAIAMIATCAWRESRKVLKRLKGRESWLETPAAPTIRTSEESL